MTTTISRVRLKNFKSFKKANIPLVKGFTTIAGANASGKSNILDGILFGLGITSLKMVRASKLTDLVNHDAADNYAQVEITLANKDREFEINRTIDKQGKSVYRLNGKRCTLNEIASLLKELNIRVDGYNIIVQGDITRIIEMNPLQRREIIDDLAGLREFDEKKDEALKNLGKVETKIKEVRIVLNEREDYLKELEEEKNAALKFQQLNEELKQSKITVLFLEIKKLEKEIALFQEKEGTIAREMNKALEERNSLNRQIKDWEQKFEELNQALIASSEKTFEGLGKSIEEKKSEIRIREERIESKQSLIARNENKIQSILKENKELMEALQEKKASIEKLTEEKQEISRRLNELEKIVQEKSQSFKKKNEFIEVKQQSLKELMNSIAKKNEAYFKLKSFLDSFEKEKSFKEKQLKLLEERKKRLLKSKEELLETRQEIKRIKERYAGLDQEIQAQEKKLRKALESIAAFQHQAKELNESISQLKAVKAACPVCDSRLDSKKKTDLIVLKKSQLLKAEKSLADSQEKRKAAEAKCEELAKINARLQELKAKDQGFEELKKELAALELDLKEFKAVKTEKELEEKTNGLNKAVKELKQLKEKKFLLENQINEAHLKSAGIELEKVRKKLEETREKKIQAEKQLLALEAEVKESSSFSEQYSSEETKALKAETLQLKEAIALEESHLAQEKSELKEMEVELKKMQQANKDLMDEKIELNQKIIKAKQETEKKSNEIANLNAEVNALQVEKSKNEVRIADLREEFQEFKDVKIFSGADLNLLKKRIAEIEEEIRKLGEINMKAVKNFEALQEEVKDIYGKSEKLEQERIAVLELIEKIEFKRTSIFMDCFQAINDNFNKMYSSLSGGEGRLSLSDAEKPLESGLLIEARHYGEKLKSLDSMSGGEKALTALAFLFSLQMYEPAPFYIFDEADAALDKPNSKKLAKIIKEISRKSQFVAITHNDALIEQSDQIIGVTLNQQKSSVIGLKVKKELQKAA